jgi:phosphoglucosamine mutase
MKYFGTDGIRGKNEFFTSDFLKKAGRGAVSYLGGNGTVLIARDTRVSGKFIVDELKNAILACGVNVVDAGMTATPVCAYLTKKLGCSLGIMVSASHNPPEYNGIKYFGSGGGKLHDEEKMEECIELAVEQRHLPAGKLTVLDNGDELYIDFIKTALNANLSGLKVVLDTANGATALVAPKLFAALGAEVKQIFSETDGININLNCGAMHLDTLENALKSEKAGVLGLSYDGDGDRLMASINNKTYDGDHILYIFAKTACVKPSAVVGTLMTNLGLEKAFKSIGVDMVRADVGDKYVYREMINRGLNLGGEASGHLILKEHMETGDGLLASVALAKIAKEFDLAKLTEGCKVYPQVNDDIMTTSEVIARFKNSDKIKTTLEAMKQEVEKSGSRAVVRASGTEPRIRVMVEAEDEKLAAKWAAAIKNKIAELVFK